MTMTFICHSNALKKFLVHFKLSIT
uniref:Uncharacterized protein n=1 Tax=Anguilla anguilla TaxID=7936 RepID=A0A0E9VY29_ANGAN